MKRKRLKGESPEEIGNGSIIPKKGVFDNPLNGITPEMWEAAKPKLKGIDFKASVVVGTSGPSCPTKGMLMNPEKYKGLQKMAFQWDELGQMPDYKNKKIADTPSKIGITLEDLEKAARYIHKSSSPKIDLIIYQAEGYFVGEYVMEGRSGKTKAGWKGIKELVERYSSSDFKVTYNGVKYEVEDNKKLFKKLFDEI